MRSASSRIWTRIAMSISHDDNHYTTGTLMSMISFGMFIDKECLVSLIERIYLIYFQISLWLLGHFLSLLLIYIKTNFFATILERSQKQF